MIWVVSESDYMRHTNGIVWSSAFQNTKYAIVHALLGKKVRYQAVPPSQGCTTGLLRQRPQISFEGICHSSL